VPLKGLKPMNTTTITLGPELTIPFAAAVRDTLFDAVRTSSGDLAVDLGAVTDMDSAGVQLLLSASRSLAERGDALQLQTPSACVREALSVFGLNALLQP
jgi:anti-sigma B factor antagonist